MQGHPSLETVLCACEIGGMYLHQKQQGNNKPIVIKTKEFSMQMHIFPVWNQIEGNYSLLLVSSLQFP